jgi:hypothetical protein
VFDEALGLDFLLSARVFVLTCVPSVVFVFAGSLAKPDVVVALIDCFTDPLPTENKCAPSPTI